MIIGIVICIVIMLIALMNAANAYDGFDAVLTVVVGLVISGGVLALFYVLGPSKETQKTVPAAAPAVQEAKTEKPAEPEAKEPEPEIVPDNAIMIDPTKWHCTHEVVDQCDQYSANSYVGRL